METQACMTHWKMTNIAVHSTKYAIRNIGNRWKWETYSYKFVTDH
jgi:hypothetical protein